MLVLGLDVGGANLKAATSDGAARERAFPLWKHPERLGEEVKSLVAELPKSDAVAVVMTGELADCFESKAEGVRAIVEAVCRAVEPLSVHFWQTGGEFVGADDAVELTRLVAAANWHALATFCGRVVPTGPALLIDVGSTTTDLIPLRDGVVVAEGLTDLERLRSGELVYTGAVRTPVCAFGPTIDVGNEVMPMAAELFATMRDVHLMLGSLPEAPEDRDTADGRPATIAHARKRLARMLCADPEEIGEGMLEEFARALARRQREVIRAALERVLKRMEGTPTVMISGSGASVAQQTVAGMESLSSASVMLLSELFEKRVSHAACAFAVARLAAERVNE